MPQIMRQCGVKNFFTTKLTWSTINRFPHSSFLWRGTDGSEVLTHVTQELGYNQGAHPQEGRLAARAHMQADVHDAFLQPTGFGDGGGGVTPEMCERARRMVSLTNVPKTEWGGIDDFFADLGTVRDQLPRHQGELYLEYHRGTFTTHGDLKAAFRGLERALQVHEAAHALTGAGPIDVHAWKRLVFSQFHDYIPGSSIWEVYKEGVPELVALAEAAHASTREHLGQGNAIFNPLPLPRAHATMREGKPVLVTLPPLSATDPASLPITRELSSPGADTSSLHTDRVRVEFNEFGEVSLLEIDGTPIAANGPLHQITLYPDYPHQYPAWDIDRQTLSMGQRLTTPAEQVACSPREGGAALAFRREISDQSWMEIRYHVHPANPVLDVELEIEWHERNTLMKALFPTDYQGRFARFGSPYGSVLRGQQPGDPRDEAMFEACASRWAVVTDDNQSEGFFLVTEAKYGMGCREGLLGLSVVRSVTVTGEEDGYSKMFPSANRPLACRDLHSDLGRHTVRYALGRFTPALSRDEQPAALADLLYTPVHPTGITGTSGLLGMTGGESLVPAWAKPLSDGGWILRLHETLGRSGSVTLELEPGWSVTRTRLAEDRPSPCEANISFRPYEIVSLHLHR